MKKALTLTLIILLVLISNISCEQVPDYDTWPNTGLATMLPAPDSSNINLRLELDDLFTANIEKTSLSDFEKYVSECKDFGFTIDSEETSDEYSAFNEEGYKIEVSYRKSMEIISIRLETPERVSSDTDASQQPSTTTISTLAPSTTEKPTTQAPSNQISKEFKEAMDSYEKFFDEYCEFMKKFKESPSDTSLLLQYSTYMQQYTDTMTKLNALNDEDLTDAELMYYLEVNNRITEKLLEISQQLKKPRLSPRFSFYDNLSHKRSIVPFDVAL